MLIWERLTNGKVDLASDLVSSTITIDLGITERFQRRRTGKRESLSVIPTNCCRREELQYTTDISAEEAKEFAESEFEKYRVIQDRLFMPDFDDEIKGLFDDE